MKKNYAVIVLFILATSVANSQTMHSILFTNMEEQGRKADRTEEMRQMKEFCIAIAESLDYEHDLRCHSGSEFTSTIMENEISSLNVNENDIVLLYYAGHGCNWDDDDWPHMALLDKQYWQSTAYTKLKAVSKKAKLVLCIASCCNMDSEGRNREKQNYTQFDKDRTKQLFLGFEGQKSIIASSSIRGQYSYSWSSGNKLGSIYTISLRKTITEALNGTSAIDLEWNDIFEGTKKQTLAYTNNKQLPQYKMEDNLHRAVTVTPIQSNRTIEPKANVEKIWVVHNQTHNNVDCLEIHAKINTHFMDYEGGRLVALFDAPKGTMLLDKNDNYCTIDGQVSVGADFGSHQEHATFSDINLIIPYNELHLKNGEKDYYIRIGVYDYRLGEYIHFSDYLKCHFE